MKSPGKRIKIGCFILVVIVVAAVAYQLHDREPQLLARSRQLPLNVSSGTVYFWLSQRELLVLDPASTGYEASTVDLENGVVSSSSILSRALIGTYVNYLPILSPHGNWLLTQQRVNGWYIPVAITVDGTRRASWPQDDPQRMWPKVPDELPMWLADDTHWLEFKSEDVGRHTLLVQHGIGVPDRDLGKSTMDYQVFGTDQNGSLLAYQMEVGAQIKHNLLTFDPNTGTQTGKTVLSISFPGTLTQILAPPGGDRLAFVSISGGEMLYPKWIVNRITSLRKQSRPFKLALWICRIDGKGLRELGCTAANVRPYFDTLKNLSWLPDGKSLSFVLDGKLWVTPAN
jgi:hypothetical protein